jgi:mRNA interferase HigB
MFIYLEYIYHHFMRIVTYKRIQAFIENHKDSKTALEEWYFKTTKAEWRNFSDIKRSFNSADYVGNNRFVFNIKGNNYRLVAIIIFASQKVYVRFIGTHSSYEKTDCKNI